MTAQDPLPTQRDAAPGVIAELAASGFTDATEIGRGGFGVVYRCREGALDRTVAVKVLAPDPDTDNLERFLREQRAMGRLSGHPHIVNVLQVGTTASGRPFLVMQYHPRDSLDTRIRRGGPLPWRDVLTVGVKLAGALETAHRLGIAHRDVKPANILLTDFGEPQLTDFGIARVRGGFETATGEVTGSPAYTAPEVLSGRTPTPASDVYSLAATLFCALTGHAAFERRSGERMVSQFVRVTTEPIPDLRTDGVPDELCATIEDAMAVDPASRPATAATFGDRLRAVQEAQGLPVDELAVAGETLPAEASAPSGATVAAPGSGHRRRSRTRSTTPPAPATRFRPPVTSRWLIARERLLRLLETERRPRLIVVHAPPGFGKSMLALEWQYRLTHVPDVAHAQDGVSVAWLNVDRDDDNVVWFLAHLVEAVRRVRPSLARELGQALDDHGDEAERYVLTSLIDEIHAEGERLVLIVDDWDRVQSPATTAAMAYLIGNSCHHLQVMVVGRTRVGLPVARMRVLDELVEIDHRMLAFDTAETGEFLRDYCDLDIDDDLVADLAAATDGWPAALQLAAVSLRDHADPAHLAANLSGRHRGIGEFLTENVLSGLGGDVVDFLLAAAVTERTCGSLASALSGRDRGQAMLEDIEERDLFLSRVDEDGRWFRFQPLFAEFLRQRLERDFPDRIPELHEIASRWFERHGSVGEAVDHALAAADDERAVDLVEHEASTLLAGGHATTLVGLVEKLPRSAVVARPRLQLSIAWANIVLHNARRGRRALDLVESAMATGAFVGEDAADIAVEIEVVRRILDVRADRSGPDDGFVDRLTARARTVGPIVVSSGLNAATFDAIYRGDFAEADRLQDLAVPFHERNAGPHNLMHGSALRGLAALERLDLDTAGRCFRESWEFAREASGEHSSVALLAASVLGEFLFEQGEIDEAERLLDDGYAVGAAGGVVDFKIARYVVGARIKAQRGDPDTAVARLGDGARVADDLQLPRLAAAVDNERVRLGLPRDPRHPAVGYGRTVPESGPQLHTAQLEDDTAIRLLLADPTREHLALAHRWASEWSARLDERGFLHRARSARELVTAAEELGANPPHPALGRRPR
ncbi:serine/threonine-protein kinase [Rhodococcus yananensis]|uniref:serine/threonine-protein kinase n=1 Tax=Rhodococcus yananensis TaxID=2879464 RepID=UPI001CF87828|nr:serine/threonine-protein kinase [Rhodococcus yananensis]